MMVYFFVFELTGFDVGLEKFQIKQNIFMIIIDLCSENQ